MEKNTYKLLVEAERRAYADRAYYLGDPDFVKVPTETLLSWSCIWNSGRRLMS